MMPVAVPNLIGLGRGAAESALDALLLRHIARFPFDGAGDGSAKAQSPEAGAMVAPYSVVTVSYPSPMGPLEDSSVMGPALPAGSYDGHVQGVTAGDPSGSGQGAWIDFLTHVGSEPVTFTGALYFDSSASPGPPPSRTEWMRRGAMLGLAQRAFSNGHSVRVVTTSEMFIQSIQLVAS
jgi:hypothetical protein